MNSLQEGDLRISVAGAMCHGMVLIYCTGVCLGLQREPMGSESLDSNTVDYAGNGKFAADKEVLVYLRLRIRIHVGLRTWVSFREADPCW